MMNLGMDRAWFLIPSVVLLVLTGCSDDESPAPTQPVEYRVAMRSLVADLSAWSKARHPGFVILPQNGHELATSSGDGEGQLQADYLAAIDGAGQESLFYGYAGDDQPTPPDDTEFLLGLLALYESQGVQVLVTDYAFDPVKMTDSYDRNSEQGFISFAADHRALDNVPGHPGAPFNSHSGDVTSLAEARNFLYLINPAEFSDRTSYLAALAAVDHDILLLDLFFQDQPLTAVELEPLRTKAGGGARLLICYLSIGEAEDYRYYWDSDWTANSVRCWSTALTVNSWISLVQGFCTPESPHMVGPSLSHREVQGRPQVNHFSKVFFQFPPVETVLAAPVVVGEDRCTVW